MMRFLSPLLLLVFTSTTLLHPCTGQDNVVNPAPILWEKPIDGTITDVYYEPSGAKVFVFTEEPCAIFSIAINPSTVPSAPSEPEVFYTCPDPNDIRITSFANVPRQTNLDSVEFFILMIQQGTLSSTPISGATLTGRMAKTSSTSGSTDLWSVTFDPTFVSFAPSAKPVVRTTCCVSPHESDNVYINLYNSGPVIEAYDVGTGALVFSRRHHDSYFGKLFGSMYAGSGAFTELYAGIDDLYFYSGETDSFNPTLLILDAESGNITANFTQSYCNNVNENGICESGIPAAPFKDDNGNIYFSDRANGNFALDSDLNVISTVNGWFFEFSLYFDTWLFGIIITTADEGEMVFPAAWNVFDDMSVRWSANDYLLPAILDDLIYKDSRVYYLGARSWYGFNADDGALITSHTHPDTIASTIYPANVAMTMGPKIAASSDSVLYVGTDYGTSYSVRAYDTTADAPPPPSSAPTAAPTTPNPTVTPDNPTASPTTSPTDSAAFGLQMNVVFSTMFVAALVVAALPFF